MFYILNVLFFVLYRENLITEKEQLLSAMQQHSTVSRLVSIESFCKLVCTISH